MGHFPSSPRASNVFVISFLNCFVLQPAMMEDVTTFSTPLHKLNPASRLSPNALKNQELSVLSFVDETLDNGRIENECAKQDFFGLPLRVRDLYTEQRGITQLYGKFLPNITSVLFRLAK